MGNLIAGPSPDENLAPLGRRVSKDENDKKFLLPKKAKRGVAVPRRRMWYLREGYDQANTSECVGHAVRHYLDAGPVRNLGGPDQHQLYHMAQDYDEWPGNDYEGTSVRGAFRALNKLGFVKEYRWAFDLETVVNYVLTSGPMVLGTNWYYDMFTPDRHGYLDLMNGIAGGHGYLLLGVDRDRVKPGTKFKGAGRVFNSWGENWADKGRAWLTFEDLERLIHEDGEAAVAPELKL